MFVTGIVIYSFSIFYRFHIISSFENNPYHPYNTYCHECFINHRYLVDSSSRWAFFHIYLPFLIFLLMYQKNIYERNSKFYRESFHPFSRAIKRIICFCLASLPLVIIMVMKSSNFYYQLFTFTLSGILYAISLVFVLPILLKKFKIQILGDFMISD